MAHPATLAYCPDHLRLFEIAAQVHPTFLMGIPRVWEKLHAALRGALPDVTPAAVRALPDGVRQAVLTRIGLDQCRIAATGSAPIDPEIVEFFRALGVPLTAEFVDANTLEVQPLAPDQVRRFVHTWYLATEVAHHLGNKNQAVCSKAADGAKGLLSKLRQSRDLSDLASNPLLLTMIATVHRYRGSLPGSRVELYADICSVFFGRRRQARGLDDFDRKHRLALSFVYAPSPFRTGPKVMRQAFSQWQFSGVLVLQSGLPITAIDSTAGSVYGNLVGFTRAECTGANPASSGSVSSRLNGYFNPAAFAAPPVVGDGTGFGNCGVGILRGPDQRNIDLGIQRNFAVTEASAVEFRAEFFNFTNTPKFGLPVNDRAAGPAFGVISSTASNPRIVQFALKYRF